MKVEILEEEKMKRSEQKEEGGRCLGGRGRLKLLN